MAEHSLAEIDFSVEAVCAAAVTQAGLDDFGDASFTVPLSALLSALQDEAALNPVGRAGQFTRIVELLVNRLRVQYWLQRHPEILDEELAPPVVIVGLMRTGTTMLHRLLACNPAFYAPLWYEARFPAPLPDYTFAGVDERITKASNEVAQMLAASPDLAAIHPLQATAPDEEILLLEQAFFSTVPASFAHIPGYMAWLEAHDNTPGYDYLQLLLRFLQWQRKRANQGERRWLLKSPHHLLHIDTLRSVFPGADIIQTHRDPLQTVPSACSMNCALAAGAAEKLDKHAFARLWKDLLATGLNRTLDSRAQNPSAFTDVDYRETVQQPMTLMQRLHDSLGMPLDESVATAMKHWLDTNQRQDRALHHYTLDEFGFDRQGLEQDFRRYREAHIL